MPPVRIRRDFSAKLAVSDSKPALHRSRGKDDILESVVIRIEELCAGPLPDHQWWKDDRDTGRCPLEWAIVLPYRTRRQHSDADRSCHERTHVTHLLDS
jgi:hypothetical protein